MCIRDREEGGSNGLERPEPDQHAQVRGQAAQSRADDEDPEAVDVEEFVSPHVSEPTDGGHRGHQNQEVAQTHPGHRTDTCVERPLQGGQGDGHDAGVELAHERSDAHSGHGQPECVRPAPYHLGAPRLDDQVLPTHRPHLIECVHSLDCAGLVSTKIIDISCCTDKLCKWIRAASNTSWP